MKNKKFWPKALKLFFMLNSAEHKMLISHKYQNSQKSMNFKGSNH